MRHLIPPVPVAAYSALLISLVTLGIAVAGLSIALVCLLEGVTHG